MCIFRKKIRCIKQECSGYNKKTSRRVQKRHERRPHTLSPFLKPVGDSITPILPDRLFPHCSPSLLLPRLSFVCISVLLLMLLSGLSCTSLWHLLRFLLRIQGMIYSNTLAPFRAGTDTMLEWIIYLGNTTVDLIMGRCTMYVPLHTLTFNSHSNNDHLRKKNPLKDQRSDQRQEKRLLLTYSSPTGKPSWVNGCFLVLDINTPMFFFLNHTFHIFSS